MAADLVSAFPEARAVFDAGREILGRDFAAICREGPEAELNSTRSSQPAIFLHSMAALEVLRTRLGGTERFSRDVPAFAAAGLSLGEYSALVFAGALDFEDALRIVARRGELMQAACDAERGGMVSILGLDSEKVEEVVRQARADGLRVSVANYNSPEQTVISGEEAAVTGTGERLQRAGAKRTVPLPVAGAYHSELMASATRGLEPLLRGLTIRPPRLPFYANVVGGELKDPEEIREGLIRQVESPVRWRQAMAALVDRGLKEALEPGPGRVIRGLLRNISRDVKVTSVGTCEDFASLDHEESTR
jgi:[acyl-carrier-protein] S-malonyltransferase